MKFALALAMGALTIAAAPVSLDMARDRQDRATLQAMIAQLGGGAQQASADFRKAIELDPKNPEAYLWLGVSLRKENKDAEARQALTKALELNPNRVWVKQQLDKTPAK